MNEDDETIDLGDVGSTDEQILDQELEKAEQQFKDLNSLYDQGKTIGLTASGELVGFDTSGGRLSYSQAKQYAQITGVNFNEPEPESSDVGFFENIGNKIQGRFGSPVGVDYVVDPKTGFLGKVTEDYPEMDVIGNIMGAMSPRPISVDTALAEDITGRGMEARSFQKSSFSTDVRTVSQREEQMKKNKEDEMKQRGKGDYIEALAKASPYRGPSLAQRMIYGSMSPAPITPSTYTYTARFGGEISPQVTPSAKPMPNKYDVQMSKALSERQKPQLNPAEVQANPDAYMRDPTKATSAAELQDIYLYNQDVLTVASRPIKAQAGMQVGQATQPSGDGPVGFVGSRKPETLPEGETVADDVPMDVENGTFVINAAAVEFAGSDDIKKMILDAIDEARSQGIDISGDENKIDREKAVSLLVSKGEVIVPPLLAKIIGYDKLNKINNRGKQETEKRVQENGQSPEAEALDQQPTNPAEGMAMARGGLPSTREELDRQISEDPASFYETVVAGDMGKVLAETREVRDGVNGMFNVHRLYEKMLRDIEEYKAPEVMSRTNVEMGQTKSQRDTTLMESDGRLPLIEDDMTPQNAANMYQNFPSFRRYIMDRIEAGQSEQVQGVLDNYEKFLEGHAGDNLPEQNPVYTEEDFAKARELDETETLRDLLNSRVVSETPVDGFISKSY